MSRNDVRNRKALKKYIQIYEILMVWPEYLNNLVHIHPPLRRICKTCTAVGLVK